MEPSPCLVVIHLAHHANGVRNIPSAPQGAVCTFISARASRLTARQDSAGRLGDRDQVHSANRAFSRGRLIDLRVHRTGPHRGSLFGLLRLAALAGDGALVCRCLPSGTRGRIPTDEPRLPGLAAATPVPCHEVRSTNGFEQAFHLTSSSSFRCESAFLSKEIRSARTCSQTCLIPGQSRRRSRPETVLFALRPNPVRCCLGRSSGSAHGGCQMRRQIANFSQILP